MFGRSTGFLTTACALGASAFLIPPGVAPSSHKDVAFPIAANPLNQFITIPCTACVFPSKQEKAEGVSDDLFWAQGGANNIILNFTISDDGRYLQLGGKKVVSSLYKAKVHQVPASTSIGAFEAGEVDAAALEITTSMFHTRTHPSVETGEETHTVSFVEIYIMALERRNVKLDKVTVTTLETADGQMLILHVESSPSGGQMMPLAPPKFLDELTPPQHGRPHGIGHHDKDMHKECGRLPVALCKLKHIAEDKIFGMSKPDKGSLPLCGKGSHRNPWMGKDGHVGLSSHIKGPKFDNEDNGPHRDHSHHGRPHYGRPGAGHHRHHQHSFLQSFIRGFVAVLVPVMAGVTVGMLVSLVGVIFGRLISFLWIKFVRGGRRGYASVALEESTTEAGDLKEGEVAEMAAPPYEYAPRYEDVEKMEEK